MIRPALLLFLLAAVDAPAAPPSNLFDVADLDRLADVTEPVFSPDGQAIAYTVTTANTDADQQQSDLWRVRWDGSARVRLTGTPDSSEWRPQWSGDGKWLAFLSDRKIDPRSADASGKAASGDAKPSGDSSDDDARTQVWLMPANGGPPRQVTHMPDGVEDYAYSSDGKLLAVIAYDPGLPPGTTKPKNPPPLVTDRYLFKDDADGLLGARRKHLYLVDVATGAATLLTPGTHDEVLPAFSPDGRQIAFTSKREPDADRAMNFEIHVIAARPGAQDRRITSPDHTSDNPDWETRPAWSPDGTRIAYPRSDYAHWLDYAPWVLGIVDVATGKETIPAPIDRCFYKPRWSHDGRSVYALVEQSLVTHLARIDLADGKLTELDHGDRFDFDLDVSANDRVAVLGGDDRHPYEISAVESDTLRPLGDHNAFLSDKHLADVEAIHYASKDGTAIDGLLVKPVGWKPGVRYPTIVRVHGGPVYQYSREFMPDWQAYAAHGYAVLAVNPRGSSGRGFDFAKAIRADWGHKDVEDVLAGIDHAVAMGIVDPARIGVGGWSYGGILTDYLIASDTRFKAAVSGAGAANFIGMYGGDEYVREYELELGLPWKDRTIWDRVSYPFLHADRIVTPTMYQCAGNDFNVPCHGAEQMYQALKSLGVPSQLVEYPGQHHGLTVPSYLRDRLQRNLDWYGRFLKAESRQPE
ncbi:MAG TPA: S9 family peptidase [Xanthomonadaceae bacterium]|jgi:dipeptidyl aminopeptidase/acylaminoacyl peptidase